VQAQAGDLITTNPGEVHDGRPLGAPTRRWRMVYLEPQALQAMAGPAAGGGDLMITRPVLQDARLRAALQRLFARLQAWHAHAACADAHTLACEESWAEACGLLLQAHATCRPADEVAADLRAVRERLADECLAPPTLAELAASAGLSRFQLLRRFAQAYGVPPHTWLLQQRAERARALIRQGHALAHAASACGFADQSHMTRVFVRHFGYTPGTWQRALAPQ